MMSVSRTKYDKPWGYIILGLLVAAFCYVAFCNTIFDEYGSVAPRIALYVLGYWAGSFALRLFCPDSAATGPRCGSRSSSSSTWAPSSSTALSEYFFWSEFGVRYNFIAVDYLVYTNEVVGNIMESYPVIPMTLGIVVVTLLVTWYFFRRELVQTECLKGWRGKRYADRPTSRRCSPRSAAELQHPLPGQRQRLRQRIAGQRTLQVLRRLRQEHARLRTVLPHASRSRGRSLRARGLPKHGRQPARRARRRRRSAATSC